MAISLLKRVGRHIVGKPQGKISGKNQDKLWQSASEAKPDPKPVLSDHVYAHVIGHSLWQINKLRLAARTLLEENLVQFQKTDTEIKKKQNLLDKKDVEDKGKQQKRGKKIMSMALAKAVQDNLKTYDEDRLKLIGDIDFLKTVRIKQLEKPKKDLESLITQYDMHERSFQLAKNTLHNNGHTAIIKALRVIMKTPNLNHLPSYELVLELAKERVPETEIDSEYMCEARRIGWNYAHEVHVVLNVTDFGKYLERLRSLRSEKRTVIGD